MQVQINYRFNRGFELAEESVLKIVDIFKNRIPEVSNSASLLKYDVRRADHALITYDTIGDVLKEQNGKFDRIELIKIYAKGENEDFSLIFEKNERTILSITSSNRDSALLAFAEIRDYIRSEVVRHRMARLVSVITHRQAMPLVLAISMMVFMGTLLFSIEGVDHLERPKNPNVDQKIDFIYRASKAGSEIAGLQHTSLYAIYAYISFLVITLFFTFAIKYVYQTDIFMWGKEVERVRSVRSMVGRIFWTIVIGFAVSVLAGVFLGRFKIG